MTFLEAKKERTKRYYSNVYKHKLGVCSACSGSGRYDNNGSSNCGCCDGTGKTLYKATGTILKYAGVVIEVLNPNDVDVVKGVMKHNLRRVKNSKNPSYDIEKLLIAAKVKSFWIRN